MGNVTRENPIMIETIVTLITSIITGDAFKADAKDAGDEQKSALAKLVKDAQVYVEHLPAVLPIMAKALQANTQVARDDFMSLVTTWANDRRLEGIMAAVKTGDADRINTANKRFGPAWVLDQCDQLVAVYDRVKSLHSGQRQVSYDNIIKLAMECLVTSGVKVTARDEALLDYGRSYGEDTIVITLGVKTIEVTPEGSDESMTEFEVIAPTARSFDETHNTRTTTKATTTSGSGGGRSGSGFKVNYTDGTSKGFASVRVARDELMPGKKTAMSAQSLANAVVKLANVKSAGYAGETDVLATSS